MFVLKSKLLYVPYIWEPLTHHKNLLSKPFLRHKSNQTVEFSQKMTFFDITFITVTLPCIALSFFKENSKPLDMKGISSYYVYFYFVTHLFRNIS